MALAGSYDEKLLAISAERPMTAEQIGEVMGCYGPDAVTRLRARRQMRVTVVGQTRGARRPKNLYRIEKLEPVQVVIGPYCCGFCEQARRAEQ